MTFLFQRIWSDQKTMLLSGFPSGLTEAGAEIALDLDSSSSYGQGSYLQNTRLEVKRPDHTATFFQTTVDEDTSVGKS